jgi:hypothetical protein
LHGEALSIFAESILAARAAFRHGDLLSFSPSSLTTILGTRELPARVRIGEETRRFKLRVDERVCELATAFVKDLDCVDNHYRSQIGGLPSSSSWSFQRSSPHSN